MARLVPFSGMVDEDWEVFVVNDDSTANAFVLPGGKVFVFSGILGIARNDSGLATVLGHEIAHNLADHHSERLSQDVGASIVLYSLVILGGVFGLGPLIMHFFGGRFLDVAFGFPMSRLQESEADYIGLMMMAEACYDPQEAASFWGGLVWGWGVVVGVWLWWVGWVWVGGWLVLVCWLRLAEYQQDTKDPGVVCCLRVVYCPFQVVSGG
jgi:Zn-dependent protease with chaperone function